MKQILAAIVFSSIYIVASFNAFADTSIANSLKIQSNTINPPKFGGSDTLAGDYLWMAVLLSYDFFIPSPQFCGFAEKGIYSFYAL